MGPVTKFLPPPRGYTRCKSLSSMFGVAQKAKIYQWPEVSHSEEEEKADRLLKTFNSDGADPAKVAKALELAMKLVKEKKDDDGPKEAPEEAVESGVVTASEGGEGGDEDKE